MHVGPVVAGVIGSSRPVFDCWGDTVNLASRLETAARPGTILISEEVQLQLGAGFSTARLSGISLKGLGPTICYALLDDNSDPKFN